MDLARRTHKQSTERKENEAKEGRNRVKKTKRHQGEGKFTLEEHRLGQVPVAVTPVSLGKWVPIEKGWTTTGKAGSAEAMQQH